MPNIKSQKDRVVQAAAEQAHNKAIKTNLKTVVKKADAAIGEGLFQKDRETEYLEEILQTVQFQKWFFGHYHDNRNVDEKKILLYEQIIRVV